MQDSPGKGSFPANIGTVTTAAEPVVGTPKVKPRLRGRLHQVTAFLSVPAAVAIVLRAGGVGGRITAAVYGITLIALFVVSALYHVHHWEPEPRKLMKRLDHAMI